ncbi:hypothetical protein EPUS_01529 [Endocarpon pusillum Z07020]|uniref:Major facilitator superfamily (MFS) profile domain-containing protein n=1 Tax=Endocarpon pusillum (strain Z07020 / HMAS-L-300199) TaxID=1263415 RepID=U1I1D0_ENDPU|nr:uncharacterized protein EPUS_01529 [Endocarpon pusillum Z07020]ERF75699.1 hypothetical protein EPUS_01529 [Endocarpon pusillum Z07020]
MDESGEREALLPDGASDRKRRTEYESTLRRRLSSNLPPYHEDHTSSSEPSSTLAIRVVVPISLLGVFVANADGSLVVASSQQIASEFNAMFDAQWLVTSFVLAQCASQPLYGKLSDVFGRKINLVVAYTFFAVGCFVCGFGHAYWQVLSGRAISGVGGAGMTALVSIIIADMVPVRDVAAWRSYVNVAATTGRALGGPVGGWLCDTIGWRWCFYGQVPLAVIGLVLIMWKMPTRQSAMLNVEEQSLTQKWKRVDVIGAIAMASAISAFLITLDFAAGESSPSHVLVSGFLFLLMATIFCVIEKSWAKEPILPLHLLTTRPALTAYLLAGFQVAAQYGVFYSTPLYYQIVAHSTVAKAGLRLVPAVVGNATAGLLSGWIISRTGRYKPLTILSSAIACLGYTLVTIRWRGSSNWAETLYIFCGGFGSGAIQSTTFIHLAASLDPEDMAIAGTTLYLAQNLFLLIGIQSATTILHAQLKGMLDVLLEGVKRKAEIIELAISSVRAIRQLPAHIEAIVVRAYINSLTWTFGASLVYALLGLFAGITLRESRLN